MNNNEIYRIYGTAYKEMTIRLLTEAGLAAEIRSKCGAGPNGRIRIGIKPNLVTPTPADYGATTHPEVVAGIAEYLHAHGFSNLTVLESSWVGDKTAEAFEYCGYNALAKEYRLSLLDLQKNRGIRVNGAGMSLSVCAAAFDLDFLINVPVLKGHCQTGLTCALKNLKGLLPNAEKRRFHTLGLHRPIAHLNAAVRQDFIVVDHICGDLDFEEGGNPVRRDCILAAKDPVLTDAFAADLLGLRPGEPEYLRLAEALGVGSADLSGLSLITLTDPLDTRFPSEQSAFPESALYRAADPAQNENPPQEEELPTARRRGVLDVCYAVEEIDSCSACYGTLIPALARLKEEGLLEGLTGKVAIGQGHRGKSGIFGVGDCTKGFAQHIPGCPPSEEAMLEGLRQYLKAANPIDSEAIKQKP